MLLVLIEVEFSFLKIKLAEKEPLYNSLALVVTIVNQILGVITLIL